MRCPACLPTRMPISIPAASISSMKISHDFCIMEGERSYPLTRGLFFTAGRAPGSGARTWIRLLYGGLTRASMIIWWSIPASMASDQSLTFRVIT
ncbi:MAG: hypothetical protein A4E42_00103 [Methanoregulaceae archaeon PtaU1.Bin222]|nr:MAG: hypothetical protein A4E42_00103 [Methanoregulaceae archaeon PtaU1.Bin222]